MSNSRPVVLETIRFADKRGWVEWPWKLIEDLEKDKITLFDLETDPRERTDLSTTEAAVREELLGKIRDHYADGRAAAPSRDLSQEELEQLEALGYMDGH